VYLIRPLLEVLGGARGVAIETGELVEEDGCGVVVLYHPVQEDGHVGRVFLQHTHVCEDTAVPHLRKGGRQLIVSF